MNQQGVQTKACLDQIALQRSLRDAGVLLVTCDDAGHILESPVRGNDWLADFFCGSAMFRRALKKSAKNWRNSDDPQSVEVLPGVWLVPAPVSTRRRRVETQFVAVIVSERLLESEHFHAMCQSCNQDAELMRTMLSELPLARDCDVIRLTQLVRYCQESAINLAANEHAMEGTGKQLAESYEEISLLYTIIQSMTVVQQPDRFVTIACNELLDTLPYSWIGACLADDKERLKTLAGRFIMAGTADVGSAKLKALAFEVMHNAAPDAPIVFEPAFNPDHQPFAAFGATTLVHPVTSDGRVLGLLIAGNKQGADTAASSVDIKLLGATASHMSIFLKNAALYDDLNAMFLGTLEALTASIDAKDRYTCGHSQRVAHLTQLLADAAGLDEHQVKRMHIAGLVHDVGKIGVPESVLLKPGKLTEDEFAWIRKHPEMGYRILRDIPQLKDILPGVLHHHERYDGKGYPDNLEGEDIPYVARLIGLADAFDAMSSTRTYRSALGRSDVLAEILRCGGTQFDPQLAELFVKLDFTMYDELVQEHQAGDTSAQQDKPRRAA